jgi:NADH:ubiquinone oxidoreductase subunit
MTTAITHWITWLKGEPVGTDDFGNRYYRERRPARGRRARRWVIYKGNNDASAVPPLWNAWIHYTVDQVPSPGDAPKPDWHKPHRANRTGTPDAYRPAGHTLRGGHRAKATGDYEAWKPGQV